MRLILILKKLGNQLNLIGEKCPLATASFGHGITTSLLQLTKAYAIIANGGYEINFDIEEIGKPIKFNWGKCPLATASFGHGITTTLLQLAKAYAIITNGGYHIDPTLINKTRNLNDKKKILTLRRLEIQLNLIGENVHSLQLLLVMV